MKTSSGPAARREEGGRGGGLASRPRAASSHRFFEGPYPGIKCARKYNKDRLESKRKDGDGTGRATASVSRAASPSPSGAGGAPRVAASQTPPCATATVGRTAGRASRPDRNKTRLSRGGRSGPIDPREG